LRALTSVPLDVAPLLEPPPQAISMVAASVMTISLGYCLRNVAIFKAFVMIVAFVN
jgi:hypothetical protein